MLLRDLIHLSLRSLLAHRMRSALTILGIAMGIVAVILLTAIGEGIHQFVLAEFSQFGTNVVEVSPGKRGAKGGPPGLPSTTRDLTLDDTAALARIAGVVGVTPMVWGNSEVEGNSRLRRTTIYGVGPAMTRVFTMTVSAGQFLPPDDPDHPRAFAILGAKVKDELFGDENPLGSRIRIAGEQFRVIGVMAPKGQFLGTDLDDTIYLPAARALALYNRSGLMTVNLAYHKDQHPAAIEARIRAVLATRHGRVDFTITTQEDMLKALSKILDILTAAVGALGGISLLVGGVGIATIMIITVAERTSEVGLLLALGATKAMILTLFLSEALTLGGIGGLIGLTFGGGIAGLVGLLVPALPVRLPVFYVVVSAVSALALGLLSGVLPARRAADLSATEALRSD
ncbi:MAG: ABC transporter permease [Zoogloeaceae bacterium]|nr:ABC transporter permease [Zoogloeaceae bacterium]